MSNYFLKHYCLFRATLAKELGTSSMAARRCGVTLKPSSDGWASPETGPLFFNALNHVFFFCFSRLEKTPPDPRQMAWSTDSVVLAVRLCLYHCVLVHF